MMPKSSFILALCLLFVLPACNIFDNGFLSSPLNEQEIIRFVGAPLPESASQVEMWGEAALDTMVILRFEMDANDVEAYLASLSLNDVLREGYTPFTNANAPYSVDWWDVDTSALSQNAYRGLRGQNGNKFYNVLVISTGEMTTLYIQVFNT